MAMAAAKDIGEVSYRGEQLEAVKEFKYLGMQLNGTMNEQHMGRAVWRKAKAAGSRVVEYVKSNGWKQPATRLLLLDVYVRTLLLQSVVVWGVVVRYEHGVK
jgi:hypothetical protein